MSNGRGQSLKWRYLTYLLCLIEAVLLIEFVKVGWYL
jgi:hypothetical protein